MENTFPILLERDDIKEEVAKWIQYTMNKINKYKNDLAKCDTSNDFGKDKAALISEKLKKDELKLTKLDNFYLSIGNEKYHNLPQRSTEQPISTSTSMQTPLLHQ